MVVVPAAPSPAVVAPADEPATPAAETETTTVKVRDPFKPLVVPRSSSRDHRARHRHLDPGSPSAPQP